MDVTFRPLITARILHICLCLIVVAVSQAAGQENLDVTGTVFTTSSPISNGFVFVEGQYLDAPYVVSRKGLSIFINETLIQDYSLLKLKELPPPERTRPIFPSNISTNADPNDPVVGEYLYRMGNFLTAKLGRTEAANEMISILKTLPFIREVSRDPSSDTCAIVTFRNGHTVNMGLLPFTRKPAVTPANVVVFVSSGCQYYKKCFEEGDFYSFSAKGNRIHTFSAGTAKEVLPNLVKVLRSSQNDEAKAKELIDMLGVEPIPREHWGAFVTNLSTSKQLDDRVMDLWNIQSTK